MEVEQNKIPEGYIKTEVGVIPVDWAVRTIDDLTSIVGDGIHATPVYSSSGKHYFINGNNIVNGKITLTENTKKVALAEYIKHKKVLTDRTIFLSINGTIGNLAFYNQEPIILGKSAAYFNIKKNYSKDYVFYSLQTSVVRQYFEDGLTGTTIKNLGLGTIRSSPIPIPNSEKEQAAISNALSDVDALITSLEKLIAKKSAIKTAAMQQLLTGKKRLPPFNQQHTGYKQTELGEIPEGWEVRTLGSLCSYQNGTTQEQYFNKNGGYKVISIGNYSPKGKFVTTGSYIDPSHDQVIKKFILNEGDLTMILNDKTAVGTIIGRVLLIDKDNEYVMNQRTMRLTPNGTVSSEFLHFLINSDFIHKTIVGLAKPGTQIYVNTDDVTELPLCFPVEHEEQKAIVDVLMDIDAEIDVLQQRLNKTKKIKQGMLQELLTGKTRLAVARET
jgi:type I restriction enzyme S subunit